MHDEPYYERRVPIRDLGPWKNFLRFLWDRERHAVFDRTLKQWGQLGLFYLCFYGLLFTLFGLHMRIGFKNIPKDRPYMEHPSPGKFITGSRILFHQPLNRDSHSGHPGLGFVPNIHAYKSLAPVIWINKNNRQSHPQRYIDTIYNFFSYYRNSSGYNYNCDSKKKPCFFDINSLGKCSTSPYGYSEPYKPCVYIKFNRRFGWTPIYYNATSELPEYMPWKLKSAIKSTPQAHIWISCSGVTNFDNQHMGNIDYLPFAGLPVKYFPFTGHPNYLSPTVALLFNNITANRLITIKCYPWAYNIDQDNPLYFQLLIE
ncbi:sodium/potassium-transporting ATPase subunit beta-like isoform X2 [Cotesia glomerata]|nr:sodium/potassium-transporting ATPase subunit beta-like isoform X2 [Cotesia glomerata]